MAQNCFIVLCPIGKDKLAELIANLADPDGADQLRKKQHGRTGKTYPTDWRAKVCGWLASFARRCADVVPISDERHIPVQYTWARINSMCREFFVGRYPGCKPPSPWMIRDVKDESFPELRLPKKTRLGKCDTCIRLRRKLTEIPSQLRRFRQLARDRSMTQLELAKLEKELETNRAAVEAEFKMHCQLAEGERRKMEERNTDCATIDWVDGYSTDAPTPYSLPWLEVNPRGWFHLKKMTLQVRSTV